MILVILFLSSVVGIGFLPSDNNRDEEGMLISINHLKHLRGILIMIAYITLMSIFFTASNIALSYFIGGMFGNLLFDIYTIMMFLLLPMFVLWLIWIFHSIFQDRKLKAMLDRGVEMGGSV